MTYVWRIFVQDTDGTIYFVGDRSSRVAAEESVGIYNRDPLSSGRFYCARVRVTS